jgi:hypothetical protein
MESISVYIDGKEVEAKELVEVVYHATEDRHAEVTITLAKDLIKHTLAPIVGKLVTEEEDLEDMAESMYMNQTNDMF